MPGSAAAIVREMLPVRLVFGLMQEPSVNTPFAFDHDGAVVKHSANQSGVDNTPTRIAIDNQVVWQWRINDRVVIVLKNPLDTGSRHKILAAGKNPTVAI